MKKAFRLNGEVWVAIITGGAHGAGCTPNPSMSWSVEYHCESNPNERIVHGSLPNSSFGGETEESLAERLRNEMALGEEE